jgi:hypothetical protein
MSEATTAIIGFLAIVLIFAVIGALIFMALWNWIVPAAFNGPEISFWMAWGILILVGFIGRSFRSRA